MEPNRNRVREARIRRATWLLPTATAIVGLAVAGTAARVIYQSVEARRDLEIRQRLNAQSVALQQRIDHHVSLLHHLAALFRANRNQVDHETFSRFVTPILQRQEGIQALEWIPRVGHPQRGEVEAAARRSGIEGFTVRERRDGALVPAADRAAYFPVLFVEPRKGNEAAVGFDLASDPVRRQALVAARDAGGPIATRGIRLVQEPAHFGFLIFLPVYAPDDAPTTVAGRRAKLLGFVLGVFTVPHLVESAIAPTFLADAALTLTEPVAGRGEHLIYQSTEPDGIAGTGDPIRLVDSLRLPGHTWTLELRPTRRLLASFGNVASLLATVVGLLLAVVLSVCLPFLIFARVRAQVKGERKRLRQRLDHLAKHQATHDPLTRLVNRPELERRLGEAIGTSRRTGIGHTLLYLDLDRFKMVNDTAGHAAGDQLLRDVAEVLTSQLHHGDTAARLGGDELCLLLMGCSPDDALGRARTLIDVLGRYRLQWDEMSFETRASIGIVAIDRTAESTAQVLSRGDLACYAAKRAGRNRIHVFRPGQGNDRELAEGRSVVKIARAIEQGRLLLYSQPIVPLRQPESPVIFEVLLRMLSERGDVLPPGSFIPAAERFGMIGTIDRWVIAEAFNSFHASIAAIPDARMAINLSGSSIADDSMLSYVENLLAEHRVPPHRVIFEITETAAITNLALARRFMTSLRMQGCRFALDDVGSGLSSFGYLKRLPVDFLKIAGTFVRDMSRSEVDRAMVAAIHEVGHIMGLETVAEWVEETETVDALEMLGVDYAQGYALGAPGPIADSAVALPDAVRTVRMAS